MGIYIYIYIYIGMYIYNFMHMVGGWPSPLKNHGFRQLGLLFPIYGKIRNVPNHQPDIYIYIYMYREL